MLIVGGLLLLAIMTAGVGIGAMIPTLSGLIIGMGVMFAAVAATALTIFI